MYKKLLLPFILLIFSFIYRIDFSTTPPSSSSIINNSSLSSINSEINDNLTSTSKVESESVSSIINVNSSSSEEKNESVSSIDKPTYIPTKVYKIYINPSVQINNLYYDKINNEGKVMNDIGEIVYKKLKLLNYVDVKINNNYLSLKESIIDSNSFNPDFHIALHSNAGGGNGYETYCPSSSNHYATHMNNYLSNLGNFKNRGVKNGNHLYEIKNVKAKERILMETLFHDHKDESKFLINNKERIGDTIYRGIVSYIDKYLEK